MGPKRNPNDLRNQTGHQTNRNVQESRGQYRGNANRAYDGQSGGGYSNERGGSRQGQSRSGPQNDGGNSQQVITYEGARNIEVYANHFPIKCSKKDSYMYDVQIVPKKGRDILYEVMTQVQTNHYSDFHPAYDGQNCLYSARLLPFTKQLECQVKFGDRICYDVTIAMKKRIDMTVTFEVNDELTFAAQQCLNVILSAAPAASLNRVGRCFFDLSDRLTCTTRDLGNGLKMYQGIKQTAIMGWKMPFMNLDVASKAFTKAITILELIKELKGDPKSYLHDDAIKELGAFLRGLKVEYKLPNDPESMKRKRRVNRLEANAATYTFDLNKSKVVLLDYYKSVKKYNIQYPLLPCLWIGCNKQGKIKIVVPIELCTLVPRQVINNANSYATSNLIKAASTNTQERKQKIMDSMKKINYQSNPTLKEFGITVDLEMVKVPARVLEPPTLLYKDKAEVLPSKGVWNLNFDQHKDKKFYQSMAINKWAILCLYDKLMGRDKELINELQKILIREGRYRGMIIKEPEGNIITHISDRQQGDRRAISNYFRDLKEQKYQLAFVVLNDDKKGDVDSYAMVKQVCELDVGFLTQCIRPLTITRKLNTKVIQNLLMKVNAKLNGINHILKLFPLPSMKNVPIMIMGADVTHPSAGSIFVVQPSIAAVTASIDPHAFRYAKSWRLQEPRMEYITELEGMTRNLLMEFYRRNNQLRPQRIMFYRDGVADSQFEYVKKVEVQAIKRACKSLESTNYEPAITFIVVQKRHHTRFFPLNPRDTTDRMQNVPVGTSVSQVITQPGPLPNFFLQSHASGMGVARPGKYRAIYDDAGMNSDELQKLSYYLCFLCARCTSSISYPVPTYYAHLTAARAKEYCRGEVISEQEDSAEKVRSDVQKIRVV